MFAFSKVTVESLKDCKQGLSKINEDLIKEVHELQEKICTIEKLRSKEKKEFENMKIGVFLNNDYFLF